MNFNQKVYNLCKKIPKGRVSTYKEIANKLKTKAYRAVGQALRNNPNAPIIPCHRVISSSGNIYGFKGKLKGTPIKQKIELLKKEGIQINNNKIELTKFLHKF
ncbi:cysteine methyltransferase [archaeon]|nr:cysteine methyltransferase [archaeon]|tara:strand:- start:146 stop:454 length:309 start_codon:yes stop_codon:yes gene_type:complete